MKRRHPLLLLLIVFNLALNAQNNVTSASGQLVPVSNTSVIISPEGGANFGKGKDIYGKLYNTTGITTSTGTIGTSTATSIVLIVLIVVFMHHLRPYIIQYYINI